MMFLSVGFLLFVNYKFLTQCICVCLILKNVTTQLILFLGHTLKRCSYVDMP